MARIIALLRGINVGGHRRIKMHDLKQRLSSVGLKNISTYIQSGNVIFDTEMEDPKALSHFISNQIRDAYGYEVPVIIRSPKEIERALDHFPFEKIEGWKGYISFLSGQPDRETIQSWEAASSDIEKFAAEDNHLFSLVNKQAKAKPTFSNSFVEKLVKGPATTRNLQTVRTIFKMS